MATPLVQKRLGAVMEVISDSSKWTPKALFSTVLVLSKCLADLMDAEGKPFKVVDSELPFEQRAQALLSWARSHGAFECVAVDVVSNLPTEEGERGVVTRDTCKAGSTLMRVPADLALSTTSAEASHELGPLLDHPGASILRLMPVVLLSVHILVEHAKCVVTGCDPGHGPHVPDASTPTGRTPQEAFLDKQAGREAMRGEASPAASPRRTALAVEGGVGSHPWGSPWRAYLSTLPPTVANCVYWKAADWAALRGTAAFEPSAAHLRSLARVYCNVHDLFVTQDRVSGFAPHVTWDAFRWAIAMVMSRQNRLPGYTGGQSLALVPVFDMVNHSKDARGFTASASITSAPPRAEGSGGDAAPPSATICLELRAYRDFEPGEQVTHSYGFRPGTELLKHQGFVSPEALGGGVDMGAPVYAGLPVGEDPLLKIRINALAECQIGLAEFASMEHLLTVQDIRMQLPMIAARKAAGMAMASVKAGGSKVSDDDMDSRARSIMAQLDSLSPEELVEMMVPEAVRWRWTLTFPVPCAHDAETAAAMGAASKAAQAVGNSIPADKVLLPDAAQGKELLVFCRIACMDKVDATSVLRLMQGHKEKQRSVAAAAGVATTGSGHSHGGQACDRNHGPPSVDIGPMSLPPLRAETEAKARAMAASAVAASLALMDEWPPTEGGATGMMGVIPAPFLDAYRASQRAMLEQALASVRE